ncbi:5-dehydro-4-deoxyglucarate dehydratase [Kribbella alba]|uniref:Probable 5-dehydro-4-deoxyglucarate dehydratase n=1 Tax=Kribbella alba TaxID=190197 RepID=A0ABP4QY30_9ACTN
MRQLNGLLFFPVTPFTPAGDLNLTALAQHLQDGLSSGPGAVFVACGTGEFHALSVEEYAQVVETAVRLTAGQVPVFAGAGGPIATAQGQARVAEQHGVDGLLLMPPYLVEAPHTGLVRYTKAVASATELPLIVYHRGAARFDPQSAAEIAQIPSVIGLKDGLGDLDLLTRIMSTIRSTLAGSGKSFQFFNGMPTAELTAPAYRGIGVDLYSSAVFCFAPEIALDFHRALVGGDHSTVERLIDDFFVPLVTLRSQVPGYAVSLVKAGVRLRGLDVGGVRPPLIDPTSEHVSALRRILEMNGAPASQLTEFEPQSSPSSVAGLASIGSEEAR